MTDEIPPPVSLSDKIRGMDPGTSLLVEGSPAESVRAIASRIKLEKGYRTRKYTTRQDGGHVRIWRLT